MYNAKQNAANNYRTMMTIAYAFAVVATVIGAFAIIPMCWMIPMTIAINNKRKAAMPQKCLGLGICSLIFLALIPGIFVIIAYTFYSKWENTSTVL
ncbi:hypothetical protein [Mesoplasma lactucae]|uniref:Uncharacterized protein n=1 Tax=Mesoplasma lactucae ATCC 49193 TaxID=81460 RepID=A0A291IR05_9MOLU|nr:hypothetical protein [Mesoplasma lactucae]ATG97375.1 hypothetical protein CP520_01205 [Mesoplasma lactucae ATCC 49193]ATZ20173.1 hypothetical protein MLACT_v1c03520 [Mesoplasma lactucae ATCC 49193]MCL8216922.1 hypothetical protein [Mesoplasma lactucae ATCC 49193]